MKKREPRSAAKKSAAKKTVANHRTLPARWAPTGWRGTLKRNLRAEGYSAEEAPPPGGEEAPSWSSPLRAVGANRLARHPGAQSEGRRLQRRRGSRTGRDSRLLMALSLARASAQIQAYVDFLHQYNRLPPRSLKRFEDRPARRALARTVREGKRPRLAGHEFSAVRFRSVSGESAEAVLGIDRRLRPARPLRAFVATASRRR